MMLKERASTPVSSSRPTGARISRLPAAICSTVSASVARGAVMLCVKASVTSTTSRIPAMLMPTLTRFWGLIDGKPTS